MRRLTPVLIVFLLLGCSSTPAQTETSTSQSDTIQIVTTMSILADMIKNVGGERVNVTNIIPQGAGPEDYQATPGDAQTISQAEIVFFNGHGLEEWLEPLFANAAPNQPRIELSASLEALKDTDHESESDEEHADHAHEEGNPHFWLDPTYAMTYTQIISSELSKLDPAGAAVYATNAERYLQELAQLDADLQAQAATLPSERRKLITNHDAFPYFANRYGFTVVGVVLENPEAELSAGDLNTLIETIKAENIPAIFSESQFNQKTSELLASEAGITTIGTLYTDSLGDNASTYIAMMRYNMNTIVNALK